MAYANDCKDILDLFKLVGKEIPGEDSDMGRAVQILQTICDTQSHTISVAEELADEIGAELTEEGWEFYRGNAACNPYATKIINGKQYRIEQSDFLYVIAFAAIKDGKEIDIASDIFEALEEIETNIGKDDFTLEFDGNEYRLINDSDIWEIYSDEIKNIVEDCYSDVIQLDKIPDFIAVSIDWDQTAKNAYVDGYGHTFSSYDGSEEESAGYYIFRTN